MDLSMKWLADYVDCDMPIKDFVSALTLSGSKVECFEQEGKDISNVVVGKVVSMDRPQYQSPCQGTLPLPLQE